MAKIFVGCKLPHGLHLDHNGARVTLNGSKSGVLVDADGVKTGLTEVDKDFFDAWLAGHKDAPYVVNGMIFANDKAADTKAEAAEMSKVKTGFEGLDPKNPAPGIEKRTD
jgi:hypothetical protein